MNMLEQRISSSGIHETNLIYLNTNSFFTLFETIIKTDLLSIV